jgi:hypothetical protein
MTGSLQVWHYGLVARWWAEFLADGPEIEYFKAHIERMGQAALDVACGAGRLLVSFLHAGLDIDSCDVSADVLGDYTMTEASAESGTLVYNARG